MLTLVYFSPNPDTNEQLEESDSTHRLLKAARRRARATVRRHPDALAVIHFGDDPHDTEQIPGAQYDDACSAAQAINQSRKEPSR